ncbi:MAG: hypothetical protein AAFX99_16555 [Myxococcota bacterium]
MTTVVVMRIPSLLMVLGFGMVLQWGSPARVLAHERSPSALLLHERPDGAVEVTCTCSLRRCPAISPCRPL